MVRKAVIFLTVFVIGAAAYLVLSENGLYHVQRLQREKAALEHRIALLHQQKSDYEAKIVHLTNDATIVEREIRSQLKYVRDDETVFVVSETTPTGAP
jgi:cell division protein FtsB